MLLFGGLRIEELALRMGHAANLDHTKFKTGLVTTKIIADQLALPALQEVTGMLPGAAGAEVVNDCRCCAELAGDEDPDTRHKSDGFSLSPVFHRRS